jgi:hypothetical protein
MLDYRMTLPAHHALVMRNIRLDTFRALLERGYGRRRGRVRSPLDRTLSGS